MTSKNYLSQLDEILTEYLVKKAPVIPSNIKEAIVKFGPWVTLVLLIVSLPAIAFLFGLGFLLAPFGFLAGMSAGTNNILGLLLTAVQLIMEAMAIPGLFKRSRSAWNLVYYSALVGVLQNLVTLNVGGLIIGSLLSLYILFQVREYYK